MQISESNSSDCVFADGFCLEHAMTVVLKRMKQLHSRPSRASAKFCVWVAGWMVFHTSGASGAIMLKRLAAQRSIQREHLPRLCLQNFQNEADGHTQAATSLATCGPLWLCCTLSTALRKWLEHDWWDCPFARPRQRQCHRPPAPGTKTETPLVTTAILLADCTRSVCRLSYSRDLTISTGMALSVVLDVGRQLWSCARVLR